MLIGTLRCNVIVSIHAPGRGATEQNDFAERMWNVSIHAPGRGATPPEVACHSFLHSFNSRTREGCDPALTSLRMLRLSFNSRTREGCDLEACWDAYATSVSIHAPGRGATTGLVLYDDA